MSGRLTSSPEIASPYHEQQHPIMTSAVSSPVSSRLSSAHFPAATALHQQLQEYHQPVSSGYPNRYHANSPNYLYPAYASYSLGQQQQYPISARTYMTPHRQLHQNYSPHQYMHAQYESTYNGRLMGSSSNAGLYTNRNRYLPYQKQRHHHHQQQQQQQQHMHGMLTPAGQQLIPSSVLHYPPRNSAYYQQQQHQQHYHVQQSPYRQHSPPHLQPLPQPQQEQQPQQQCHSSIYNMHTELLKEPQYQQQHHMPQPVNVTSNYGCTLGHKPFNIYADARNFHEQYASPPIATSLVGQHIFAPAMDRPNPQQRSSPSQSLQLPHNLPTLQLRVPSLESEKLDVKGYSTGLNEKDYFDSSLRPSSSPACTNMQLGAATDCLTTTPPLVSATGTDSGISSCSMRARSDDSTRSTPIYNGEYPLSVGSSSSTSYHCGTEGKEHDDAGKDKEDMDSNQGNADIPQAQAQAQEQNQHDPANHPVSCLNSSGDKIITVRQDLDKVNKSKDAKKDNASKCREAASSTVPAASTADAVAAAPSSEDDSPISEITSAIESLTQKHPPSTDEKSVSSPPKLRALQSHSSASGAETTANSSLLAERCSAAYIHASDPCASQHQLQRHSSAQALTAKYVAHSNSSSWSPLPSSPSSWTAQCSPKARRQLSLSPPVPVPPHNSPVDYSYTAAVAAAAAVAVAAASTNKNRIIECDLIPSKKSKRKSSTSGARIDNEREEIRNITPLPGFQQAFGSTEIGRFSETFLLTPPGSMAEESLYQECFRTDFVYGSNWPPHEANDFGRPRTLSKSIDLHFDTGAYSMRDYLAFERYSYNYNYRRNRGMHGSFNELHCNGY